VPLRPAAALLPSVLDTRIDVLPARTKLALIRIGLAAGDLQSLPSFDPESKSQDPRFGWFQKSVGTLCYELDAVSPPDLRSRVEEEF